VCAALCFCLYACGVRSAPLSLSVSVAGQPAPCGPSADSCADSSADSSADSCADSSASELDDRERTIRMLAVKCQRMESEVSELQAAVVDLAVDERVLESEKVR
jgi:hypothetical protein